MSGAEAMDQFKAITGASTEAAKFYLDAAKGDLNAAMANWFETSSTAEGDQAVFPASRMDDDASAAQTSSGPSSSAGRPVVARKSRANQTKSAFNTMGSLRQSDDQDDDEDDKPAEYYTGGEKSGLGVIDPAKKKDGGRARALIQEILKKATGGEQTNDEDEAQTSNFKGSGYTLGGEDEESRRIDDPNESFKKALASKPPKVSRVLKLWKDGFSVDDGRLYRYDDPANKDYLEAINNGRAPLSLLNVEYGQAVDVNVEKRTEDNYQAPPKIYKPFEGSGHRLGSENPPVQTSAPSVAEPRGSSAPAGLSVQVDESQPTTSLQIRLASGDRVVSRFNTSHTLAEVYAAVDQATPANRPYTLLTPFPRKEYAKDQTTLENAGLLKGTLQQKFN